MSLPIYELGDLVTMQVGRRQVTYRIIGDSYDPDTDVEDVKYRLEDTRSLRPSEDMIREVFVVRGVLEARALEACEYRGHEMSPFDGELQAHTRSGVVIREVYTGTATCTKCGAWVQVETHPAANGIDVGGPAVAVSCGEWNGDE